MTNIQRRKPFPYGASPNQLPVQRFFHEELQHVFNSDTGIEFFKSGRSTSITRARFSKLKSVLISQEPERVHGGLRPPKPVITWEYAFASSEGPFAESGDSGTFVFNQIGGVVGLLWGGAERSDTAYVTPIEAIFDDIKEVTGALEVRIARN
jgi:hypothetical protein